MAKKPKSYDPSKWKSAADIPSALKHGLMVPAGTTKGMRSATLMKMAGQRARDLVADVRAPAAAAAAQKVARAPRGMTPAKAAAVAAYTKEFGKAPPSRMTASVMLQRVGSRQSLKAEFVRIPGPSNADLVRSLRATAMSAKRLDIPSQVPAAAIKVGVTPLPPRLGQVFREAYNSRPVVIGRRISGALAGVTAGSILRHNGAEFTADAVTGMGVAQAMRPIKMRGGFGVAAAIGLGYALLSRVMPSRSPATPEGVRSGRIDAAREAARAATADHGQAGQHGQGASGPSSDGMTAAYQRRNPHGGMTYVREYQTPVKAG